MTRNRNITPGTQVDVHGERGVITNTDDDIVFITMLDGRALVHSVDEIDILDDLPLISVSTTTTDNVDDLIDMDEPDNPVDETVPSIEEPEGVFGPYATWDVGSYIVQAMNNGIQIFANINGDEKILLDLPLDDARRLHENLSEVTRETMEIGYYAIQEIDGKVYFRLRQGLGSDEVLARIPRSMMDRIDVVFPGAIEWMIAHPFE